MSLFSRLLERRDTTYQHVWGADLDWSGQPVWSGARVNRDTVLGLSAVFACVRFLVDAVSTLPVDVVDAERPDWLDQPIPRDPSTTLVVHWQQVLSSLLLDGNSFTIAAPDIFRPAELRVADPRNVQCVPQSDGSMVYRLTDGTELDWTQVIHIPLIRLPGASKGVSPLEAERQTFGAALAQEEYASRFYSNGANHSGVIEIPAGAKVSVDELKAGWEDKHTGLRNAHRPGVLTGGATWKPLSITPDQAQFIETAQLNDERIFRIYRIPPALAGMVREGATSNASSVSQALAFEKHTVRPLVTLIEAAYRPLVGGGQLKFNTKGLLRGDPKTQAEIYHYGLTDQWLKKDEVREKEDMPLFGGTDGGFLETPNNNAPTPTPSENPS